MKKKSIKSIVLSLILILLLSYDVFATISTAHYFNGGEHTYSNFYVTSTNANISYPSTPTVGTGSATSAWTMCYNSSLRTYAQVGWARDNGYNSNLPDNSTRYFFECYDGSTDYLIVNGTGPAVGSNHACKVTRDSTWTYSGTVDGAFIGSYANQVSFASDSVKYSEELGAIGDPPMPTNAQYIGTTTSHARFSNISVIYNGTTYYSPSLAFVQEYTVAGQSTTNYISGNSSSYFDVWDTRY